VFAGVDEVAFLCEPRRPFMLPIITENDVTVRAREIGFLGSVYIFRSQVAPRGAVFAKLLARSLARSLPGRAIARPVGFKGRLAFSRPCRGIIVDERFVRELYFEGAQSAVVSRS